MASRNERSSRSRRSTEPGANRPSVHGSRGSRNEMGRYSRYSSDARSYPGDSRSSSRRYSGVRPVGSAPADGASAYSRGSSAYSHASAKKKSGRGKKIAIGVVAVVLVALIGCGTALALYINGINEKITTGGKTEDQLSAIDEQLVSAKLNEPFYMMLIGSDIREGQSQAESRSDTNILVRVDGSKNQVTMVSIPRDTAIDIDGHGVSKFNNAYTYDGAAGVIREASELCGVEIAHYAEVNFGNLVALVDAVGGVDVEVEERIDDTDADGSTGIPGAKRIIIEEGMQHLDGEAALVFARSRAYADGDFTRTENQRKLIQAIVDKVLAMPVTELPGVIEAAAQSVTTDLSVTDIINLAQQFQDEGDLVMYSAMVPSVAQYVNGISYVFTDTGQLAKMMQVVEEGGDPSGITVSDEMLAEALASEQNGGYSSYSSGYSSYGSGSGVYSSGYGSGYGSGYVTSGGASGIYGSSAASGGYATGSGAYGSGYATGSGATGGYATGGSAYGSGYASGY